MASIISPISPSLSVSDLRRRLTMPGEASVAAGPAPAAIAEESDPLALLYPAAKATVSQHTPTPRDAIKSHDITRKANAPGVGPGRPNSSANLDLFFPEKAAQAPYADDDELIQLRSETNELRELLDEMRHLLQEASESESRMKAELAQKNSQLAELQQMMGQFEEQLAGMSEPPKAKNADELEEWADELERENTKLGQLRRDLEAERRQIRQDEAELENQMRVMEVGMAKERAMMARQETELRRLNSEITQELELMQRGDPSLRLQMTQFQRRHQDILVRAGSAPSAAAPVPVQALPEPPMAQAIDAPASGKNPDSSMFRRMFKK